MSFNAGVFTDVANRVGHSRGCSGDQRSRLLEQRQDSAGLHALADRIEHRRPAHHRPVGTITDVNQQMEAMMGVDCNELIGSDLKSYFTDPASPRRWVRQTLRKVQGHRLRAHRAPELGKETVVGNGVAGL